MVEKSEQKIRIWDLPVRLFHWTLVVLIVVSYVTAQVGGNWMKLHFWSGYAILTLLLFRIVWGFVGSTTARFTHFVKGPVAAIEHLKELARADRPRDVGHNPLGGAMVIALLLGVLLQAATGLFSADTDEATVSGPLANLAPDKWVDRVTSFHHFWINVLLLLVALHVLAALTYLVWKRQNLIGAMFTGHKRLDDVVEPGEARPALSFTSGRVAIVLFIACAVVVYCIVRVGG
jgi:cytochrome b